MENRFKDKVVIVTGSSRGIGLAAAKAFLAEGAKVTVFCRHSDHCKAIVSTLNEVSKDNFLITTGDVRNIEDVKRIIKETIDKWDHIDILVNNAGVAVWKNIEDTTDKEYDEVLDTNLKGAFLFSREAVPLMKKQGYGRILHVSSGLGLSGREKYSAYSASKFGLIGLSESLAHELRDIDIRSYVLCPGAVATKLHLDVHPWENPEKMMQPEDVAPYILDAADDKYGDKKCIIVDK